MELVWLADRRTWMSRSPGFHTALALPSSLRCDCMRRHDTHAVIFGGRILRITLEKAPVRTCSRWNLFMVVT
jgi:hypothetical protein